MIHEWIKNPEFSIKTILHKETMEMINQFPDQYLLFLQLPERYMCSFYTPYDGAIATCRRFLSGHVHTKLPQ